MFRFTIRDVLWLMVVVALGLGWWIDRTAVKKFYSKFAWDQADMATATAKKINAQNKRLTLLGSAIEKAGFSLKESPDLITLEPSDSQKNQIRTVRIAPIWPSRFSLGTNPSPAPP